ncbi:MAG: hypothetical protein KAY32_15350 [Candidatus Eisenbacteria sp.]|nr:hypothetical protein [Candidatus Eisenbacteria bacterium]
MPGVRPRHIPRRPADEPIFTSPTGMDYEKRRIIFPPDFIDKLVLKGGDEYVKAKDLKTLVNAVVEVLSVRMEDILLHLASISDLNIGKTGKKGQGKIKH